MLEDIGTVFYSGPPAGVNVPRMRGVINVEAPSGGEDSISVRVGPVEASHIPSTDQGKLHLCIIAAIVFGICRVPKLYYD